MRITPKISTRRNINHGSYGRRTPDPTVAQSVRAFALAANSRLVQNMKHARRIAAIEDGEYLAVDQYCEPKQRMITAVWVLLQFIEQIAPEAHWQADAPAQISFLKDKTAYEIVVLYEDEDHLVRLLQPQEDTKYILVVPNMEFANKLILPDAPCLFATVDQTECEAPKITFYSS